MTLLVVAVLAMLLLLAGDGLLAWAGGRVEDGLRWSTALAAGMALLHAELLAWDLLGIPWSRLSILAPLLAVAGLSLGRRSREPLWRSPPLPGPRIGDGLGLLALAPFAASSVLGWTIAPDYVYHWGTKAWKFFLASGIDWEFLGEGWHWFVHPDYPNLAPGLYAATGVLRGIYRWTAGLAWSPILALATLLAARGWMLREGSSARTVSWATGGLGASLGFAGLAFRRSGDADWMMTLAVLLGVALLALPRPSRRDGSVGLVAAFAAASKMEGIPLAGFLILLHGIRRFRSGESWTLAAGSQLLVPPLVVGVPWAWGVWRHDLFSATNIGDWRWDRAAEVAGEMLGSALHPGWYGFGLLGFLLVLALPWSRRDRSPALLLLLQLVFYAFAYLITPVDAATLVATSFPRLLAHLAPAALVLAVVQLGRWTAAEELPAASCQPPASPTHPTASSKSSGEGGGAGSW